MAVLTICRCLVKSQDSLLVILTLRGGVRDIVVETQSKRLQRISELHPLYLPLQYPLIFPYGKDGYRDDIPLRETSASDVCTIDFQKRGLPHAHILLWLHSEDKPKTSKDIDKIICAKIPDKVTDCKMHDLVEKYAIHGPCSLPNQNSPCMKDEICTKRFPKIFVNRTNADADGYPVYRRRENGRTMVKKKTYLDNGFVVPYNLALLKKYRAHINVEFCNKNKYIKYLFKYVNKGHDRVTMVFYQSYNPGATPESCNEKKMYYDRGYLSACEAAWRLFNFDIHFRDPPAVRLMFTDNDSLVDVLNRLTVKQTMFLAWFHANKLYPETRNLRGCTCYDDLRKVEDHVYPTFKDACFALGLLDDDKQYIAGIKEANEWASGDYVRRLFVVHLVANKMSRPEYVWGCCCMEFAEDIAYRLQQRRTNSGPHVSDYTLRNYALIEIENILQSNNTNLSNFPLMSIPIGSMTDATVDRLFRDDLDYDVDAMREELKKYLSSITDEQKKVFDDIMDAVTNDRVGLLFLYGHGGTIKTFIWKTLSAAIRSKREIVINVASSGIVSLLLPDGRTAHSRFGLPIIVNESSTCSNKLIEST
ncbi:PREDICTED: uncharacterized protein LOC105976856 [Erythranthe guttata]|uniref:uncharacterized protein LOC105976856 n=1 Tax=Erythranthe guttata TaxID=4155 RepID=UPI00064D7C92|nr:PREDICTED: uncharacterized protein LOC105976856 [Erythranthe guttata]|eukprot:XP_012857574.1 PREDICTED: uncharacterized protein LOC105976856 [Erythranthe guttata]